MTANLKALVQKVESVRNALRAAVLETAHFVAFDATTRLCRAALADLDELAREIERTAEGVGGGALTGECVNCGCELPTGCGGQFADEDACPGYKIVSKSTAPAGIVTVPVQPTDEMLSEGHAAMVEYHKTGSFGECPGIGYGETERCYKAMLAAASAAEKENGK